MNEREGALREALQKNNEENQRWQTFLKENEVAIENMNMFAKRLTVDVMVPVGKKAFMMGQLLHTNEVLVGHYQGYFSKCTVFKAQEICKLRLTMAKEHLKKLEREAELWQNKLDKPYVEGVFPSNEEREIIEDFDEEAEKLWKERHKIQVRQAKQKEREERVNHKEDISTDKTNDEIFTMLEEAELAEELEEELNNLEIDEVNDETIRKLMSGEMKLPKEKKRLAHNNKINQVETNDKASLGYNIVKKNESMKRTQLNTNNNVVANPVIMNSINSQYEDLGEIEEVLPEEVELIKEQAKFLSAEDQVGFYDYQVQIIKHKLQLLPLRSQKDLDEKIRLLNVLDHLEELLEGVEETVGAAELADYEECENNEMFKNQKKSGEFTNFEKNGCYNERSDKKRKISFALENHTLEFKKHEAVKEMLPFRTENPQREIIKLDDDEELNENGKLNAEIPQNKNDIIQARVEKNLQYMEENQSKQDFDLVQQILQASTGEINTLYIKFKHSQQEGCIRYGTETPDVPGSPADFYHLYVKSQKALENNVPATLFINSYVGEDQVKVPVLKESDRKLVFADPKSEFSNPLQGKSILKNKSAVDREKRNECTNQKRDKKSKKKSSKNEENDCLSAYYKVMNDVVEKPLTEPEPLPDVKFIDAFAPKKRVSRFKKMRQGNEKT